MHDPAAGGGKKPCRPPCHFPHRRRNLLYGRPPVYNGRCRRVALSFRRRILPSGAIDVRRRPTHHPQRPSRERLDLQNGQGRSSRQLPAYASGRRRPLPRHRRLRKHRPSRDQPRPDRRPRHALSRRKGSGQEPADALAGPLPRRRNPVHRPPVAGRSTKTRTTRSPRPANACWPTSRKRKSALAGGRGRSATPNGWRRARSSPT